MTPRRIVLGSRGSDLALAQSRWVAQRLRELHPGLDVHIEVMTTRGDRILDTPLPAIGGKGLFTAELETALLERRIDLAVHSLKDLPTQLPPGLALGAIPPREWAADALVTAGAPALEALPEGARIGTSSLRRQAQLRAWRPDLKVESLRGNVPTRLRKLRELGLDAIVLAAAGLRRLGLEDAITQVLPPEIMLPAAAQGALGIEIRANDDALAALLAPLHDARTAAETAAERALLRALGGGCQTPIAAHAVADGRTLTLHASVCSADGAAVVRADAAGDGADPEALGRACAQLLIDRGARALLADVPLAGRRIVVTRAAEGAAKLAAALGALGAEVLEFPAIRIVPRTAAALPRPAEDYDWLVFTSANAVTHFAAALGGPGIARGAFARARVCAIGPATAGAARALGFDVTLTPDDAVAGAVAAALAAPDCGAAGARMLLPRGNLARPELPEALRALGAAVDTCIVYDTVPVEPDPALLARFDAFAPDLVAFTSGSAVDSIVAACNAAGLRAALARAALASIGPITSDAIRAQGFAVAAEAARHDVPGLVDAIAAAFGGLHPPAPAA